MSGTGHIVVTLRISWPFFLSFALLKAMVAMLSKGFLITWMNLTWTPSFCSSFLIESIPSVLIKIPEAWAAFLSPITCGKYRKSNSGFVKTSLDKKFEKAWVTSQIRESAMLYLVIIISLCPFRSSPAMYKACFHSVSSLIPKYYNRAKIQAHHLSPKTLHHLPLLSMN